MKLSEYIRENKWNIILVLLIAIMVVLFVIMIIYGNFKLEPCKEQINVCSYGRGIKPHVIYYVCCNDLNAEQIQQMCITQAPEISVKCFYNEVIK